MQVRLLIRPINSLVLIKNVQLKKNNNKNNNNNNLSNLKKNKHIVKSNILKRLSKDKSSMFDSEIELILDKKLNDKKTKNDKLFLENKFKFDKVVDKATLKKEIDDFTF